MAIRKLFISYSHKNGDWVWRTLVPMLRAAGEGARLKVLIDHERFKLGGIVKGEMDRVQDEAEGTLYHYWYWVSDGCGRSRVRAA